MSPSEKLSQADPPPRGMLGKALRLLFGASPAFMSQLAFSVVSFFSIAGLSRQVDAELLACVMAIYSLESLQVSWLDARLVNFLVLRGPHVPGRGDVWHVIRSTVLVTAGAMPLLFLAGFLVRHDLRMAALATVWASAMCLVDLMRYLTSRYHGSRVVGALGGIHVLCGVPLCLLWKGSTSLFLILLTGLALTLAIVYAVVMLRGREGERSDFWVTERPFGNSLGVEAAASSAATGLSGVLLAWINPRISVGLQLATQIVAMPATVLAQAISLPLSRELRQGMDQARFPRRTTIFWVLASVLLPLGVAIGVLIFKPIVYMLLGDRASLAYMYLPVVLLQTISFLIWQPVTLARRWTAGPLNVRRHVAWTVIGYYLLVVGAVFVVPETQAVPALMVVAGILALTVIVRVFVWVRELLVHGVPAGAVEKD